MRLRAVVGSHVSGGGEGVDWSVTMNILIVFNDLHNRTFKPLDWDLGTRQKCPYRRMSLLSKVIFVMSGLLNK